MKKDTVYGILMVAILAACLIIRLKTGPWRLVRMPEKIIPAAAILPAEQHRIPEAQERDWLRTGLRVLQKRLDSLTADSIKQLNH
jgi:cytochrome c-type biogenesis protein CcmH/NrfG